MSHKPDAPAALDLDRYGQFVVGTRLFELPQDPNFYLTFAGPDDPRGAEHRAGCARCVSDEVIPGDIPPVLRRALETYGLAQSLLSLAQGAVDKEHHRRHQSWMRRHLLRLTAYPNAIAMLDAAVAADTLRFEGAGQGKP